MTTVAELIAELQELPSDMPVHVWTREEEFDDLYLYRDRAHIDGPAVVKVAGR